MCPSTTTNQQMIQQHSTYSQMSKDSYMFRLLNKATIRLLIKEGRKATFTAAICSLISQTVQYTVLKKDTVLQKYTV